MSKRTGETKNRRAIKELQRSLTVTKRALRAAEKRIDSIFDLILDTRTETLKRIRFLEQNAVVLHETCIRDLEKDRDKEWVTKELRERIDESLKYKFPEWIEHDKKNGVYNLNTGHRENA